MNNANHLMERLVACHKAYQSADIAEAEQRYQDLLKHVSQGTIFFGDAHHLGALIASKVRQNNVGIIRIKQAIGAIPNHHEYHNTMGNIYADMQDSPKAITAFEKSLGLKPDYLSPAQNLGKLLINTGDSVSAIGIYKAALKYHATNSELRLGYVIAHKDALQFKKALALLDGGNVGSSAAYLRGQILFQLHRYGEALEAYKVALTQKEHAAEAMKNILQIYWMRGDWDLAETYISGVLKTATADLFVPISAAYVHAGNEDRAREIIEIGVDKHGDAPHLLARRARLNLKGGEVETAWDDASAALSAQNGDLYLMGCFADCALVSGRAEHALVAADEALKGLPNNQYWLAIKSTANRAIGADTSSLENYDKFVRAYELVPPKGYGSVEEYNRILKETLDELHEFTEHPLDQTLRNGTQTLHDLRLVDNPVLKAHFKALDAPIRAYMRELEQMRDQGDFGPEHPLLRRNTGDYRLAGSWSVRLRKKGFHVSHIHPQGWISSAYYVDVPDEVSTSKENAGWIHFGEPPYPIKDNNDITLSWKKIIKPKVGTLVLFPSYFWHGTVPLQMDASRVTLPIDIVPA